MSPSASPPITLDRGSSTATSVRRALSCAIYLLFVLADAVGAIDWHLTDGFAVVFAEDVPGVEEDVQPSGELAVLLLPV